MVNLPPRDRTLSAGAALWAAIKASPELRRIGALAEASTFCTGGNRGTGEAFEGALGKLLTGPAQDQITADVQGLLPGGEVPGMGAVLAVSWLPAGGRKGFDFEVQTFTEGGGVRYDWVNVKRVCEKTASSEAVALNTLLRVARGEDVAKPGRVNCPRTLLGWFAGREKIDGSDYWILEFVCDGGVLLDVRSQGLLSAVAGGKLAMHIHTNRDVVQYNHSDEVLPDDFDVNAAFPEALTRTPTPDGLRLEMLTFAAARLGLTRPDVESMAGSLLDATDEAVAAAVLAAADALTLDRGAGVGTVQGDTPTA